MSTACLNQAHTVHHTRQRTSGRRGFQAFAVAQTSRDKAHKSSRPKVAESAYHNPSTETAGDAALDLKFVQVKGLVEVSGGQVRHFGDASSHGQHVTAHENNSSSSKSVTELLKGVFEPRSGSSNPSICS